MNAERIEVNENAQKKLWLNITQLQDQKQNISSLFTHSFQGLRNLLTEITMSE